MFWETASETNASHFTMERSYDGINFVPVSTVKATGSSTNKSSYSLTDAGANPDQIIYYRLKQFDKGSDKERFTSMIDVESIQEKSMDIFPNPGDGIYTIAPGSVYTELPYDVSVYDYMGREIVKQPGLSNKTILTISDYPAGIYLVRINIKGKLIHKSIIRQ